MGVIRVFTIRNSEVMILPIQKIFCELFTVLNDIFTFMSFKIWALRVVFKLTTTAGKDRDDRMLRIELVDHRPTSASLLIHNTFERLI